MSTLDEHAFWQFACTVYQQGSAQHTLLSLQDKHQKNINLCLLLLYLETLNLQLTEQLVTQLESICKNLDTQLLGPHRTIRQTLKQQFIDHQSYSKIRQQLLNSELQLERLQQSALISSLNQSHLTSATPSNNLALYLNENQLKRLKMSLIADKS
ncbi:TIGR02444 family protein [Pseudoalteromonas sp. JBTF-M23]|uniref:TIGR02444 family protein n=1 Tax=Pseudoalteromonas caenipelagi TaxID=2726988 RepID=A0A849VHN9_9GAMM|nr:TIGR02444 family protein [Pseudoalteromonas caenipelagi]NOU52912.1 TIGR02444 family protein [Pseudoalteromonas caenipelagi]